MKVVLSKEAQAFLRASKVINEQEVVYKFGDLFIAENSITGSKRQVQNLPALIIESASKPKILKG